MKNRALTYLLQGKKKKAAPVLNVQTHSADIQQSDVGPASCSHTGLSAVMVCFSIRAASHLSKVRARWMSVDTAPYYTGPLSQDAGRPAVIHMMHDEDTAMF